MNQIFSTDNKVFRCIDKAVDCVWLSILWLVCCIPVITIGAATTAMYYVVNKNIRHDRGSLTSEYFKFFKENFKQATAIWLIVAGIYIILGFDYLVLLQMIRSGSNIAGFFILFLIITILLAMWSVYLFPYLARFKDTVRQTIKNTFVMALSNSLWSVLIVILLVFSLLAVLTYPMLSIIIPAVYQLLKNQIIERVFLKYMDPEDIEMEREKNRRYYN